MKALRKYILAAAALCMFATTPLVHAIAFSATGATLSGASGYGLDNNENSNASLLGVSFSTAGFTTQNFSLTTVNQSQTFKFGTVNFYESNFFGGINNAETNSLGVLAGFTFSNPLGITQSVNAAGTAFVGSIQDNAIDYQLIFSPITINFGLGGSFRIAVNALYFDDVEKKDLKATITLLSLPTQPPAGVPEPASMALLGLGLFGLAAARRQAMKK